MFQQLFCRLGKWKPESLTRLSRSSCRVYASILVLICWIQSWRRAAPCSKPQAVVTPFSTFSSQSNNIISSNSRQHLLKKTLGLSHRRAERGFQHIFALVDLELPTGGQREFWWQWHTRNPSQVLLKIHLFFFQIGGERRGVEVLAHLLPRLPLPTSIWNKVVKISRNLRTTPCTSIRHRVDSWDWKKTAFFFF